MYAVVMFLYTVSVTVMAVVEAGLEESLSRALRGLNMENVSLRVQQKEAIRNIVFFKERHFNYFADRLWQVIDFSVVALCF